MEAEASRIVSAQGARWPGVWVISGYRPGAVSSAFNPDQPAAEKSGHRLCPALAVDLRVGNAPATITDLSVWAFLGAIWEALGGRWGGRFDPPDPNHFDLMTGL